MDVVCVFVPDAEGDGTDHEIVVGVAPILKIVAAHPDDVGEVFVALAQKLSVRATFVRAIVEHHAKKTAGFGWIEEHLDTVLRGKVKHMIDASKVSFGGFGEIVGTRAGKIGG